MEASHGTKHSLMIQKLVFQETGSSECCCKVQLSPPHRTAL